ncbi:hypothetical protein COOONC_19183 [Cooperia oncophora]
MKLKLVTNEDDLMSLKNKYANDPLFFPIWHSIEFELNWSFPNAKLLLYSYQSGDSVLLFGYKKHRITKDAILLYRCGQIEEEEFNEALAELNELQPLPSSCFFMGEERLTEMVSAYFTAQSYIVRPYPTKTFYMTPEQMETVQNLPPPDLPNGYEIGSADPECDAEVVTKTWIHAGPNEEEQTRSGRFLQWLGVYRVPESIIFRAKLKHFPSSCVRYDGKAVGFEMIDPIGVLNHLFVLEPHRNKGLGNIIELDLARKMIRKGLKVSKCVELYNTAVLSGSARSPYWTTATDVNGEDIIYVFLAVTKE